MHYEGHAFNPIATIADTVVHAGFPWAGEFVYILVAASIIALFLGGFVYAAGYAERKVIARIHSRYGPTYVGPRGLLQLLADLIKLVTKEDIIPEKADKRIFAWVPTLLVASSFLMGAFVPFGKDLAVINSQYSLLIVFAIFATMPTLILLAGWASNSKYSLIGGLRSAAQTIAYEIPLLISVIGIVLLSHSLSLNVIMEKQSVWYVFIQPIGFIVFLISMVAALERLPMDITEAENELVAGWRTEYSGIRFLLLLQAEYFVMLFMSMVGVAVYLGGWQGPLLPGIMWFWLKTGAVVFFMFLLRGSWPRPRIDQLLDLGWKWLIPLSVINLALTPVMMKVFGI